MDSFRTVTKNCCDIWSDVLANLSMADPTVKELLNNIQNKFHIFISNLSAELLESKSIFYISEYLDCFSWNLRARNQKILIENKFFENLFINSPNEIIKSVWSKINKIQINYNKIFNKNKI